MNLPPHAIQSLLSVKERLESAALPSSSDLDADADEKRIAAATRRIGETKQRISHARRRSGGYQRYRREQMAGLSA